MSEQELQKLTGNCEIFNKWAVSIENLLMISVITVRYACIGAHLPMCSNMNLLLEPENYSVLSDYHSPVQQPRFSGALKVTRVEQMAQFPQSFRINESLLQRNANFQTLDCFLKQY